MASNCHRVPKKQWKKWNQAEQAMFNRLWSHLTPQMLRLICADDIDLSPKKRRETMRWNLCWSLADLMREWRGRDGWKIGEG